MNMSWQLDSVTANRPEESVLPSRMSWGLRMGGLWVGSGVIHWTLEFKWEVGMGHVRAGLWGVEEAPFVAGPHVLPQASR